MAFLFVNDRQISARVGGHAASNSNLDGDMARVVIWDDGTTFEMAREWVKRRYPNVDPYGPGR